MIHEVVNNRQAEHYSTVLETSGTIAHQNFSILIYLGATKRFISGATLKIIKVNAVKQDEFRYVEIASGAKQKVGGKVIDCSLNMGYFVMKANLYVMIVGSYDVMIDMDWLELYDAILNYKMKWMSLIDDEGHRRVIVGTNQGVSLRFISSLQLHNTLHKGCNLYAILALNNKGKVKGLENLLVVHEFVDMFPEELSRFLLEREL
jgi:hypothetical protein